MMINTRPSIGLGQQLAETIRLKIVSGELADGQKLSENTLAAQFGLSRGPVREALKLLEFEGLVSLTKQGVIVRGLTEKELDQLYNVRYMLEAYCLTHIPGESVPALADRLTVVLDRMELALTHRDCEEFARQDIAFHNMPFELLDHRFVNQFWDNIKDLYQTVLYVGTKRRFDNGDFAYKEVEVCRHHKLVEALLGGRRPDIEKALKEHFSRIRNIEDQE